MAYGYYDDRPRYTSLMDMIDGGGAGRSGDRFEGGGLLSLLANELFRPAGYEDRLRQRKNDTGRAVATVIDELTKRRDRRNLDRVDAYNRAEADRQAAAALMDERYDDTILAPGQGGLRRRLPQNQPATGMTYPSPTASIVPDEPISDVNVIAEKLYQLSGYDNQYAPYLLQRDRYNRAMQGGVGENMPPMITEPARVSPVMDALSPDPSRQYQHMRGDPRFNEARQRVIELMGEEMFFERSPADQDYLVRFFMEQRGY